MKNNISAFIVGIAILATGSCIAQGTLTGQNINYVVDNKILVPGKTSESQLSTLTVDQNTQVVTYMTDLGAPQQSVVTQGSPLRKDLVTFKIYDNLGREPITYSSFKSADGNGTFKSGLPSPEFF